MTDSERFYSHADKSSWGPGAWQDEPDKVQWIDRATDLDCLVVRGHHGAWCGYVGVPPGHRCWGADYETPDVAVHGGLTYGGMCQDDAPEASSICHVPFPGRPADVYWLGFDCAHFMDRRPGLEALERSLGLEPLPYGASEYRTLFYVRGQVTDLAAQLADRSK